MILIESRGDRILESNKAEEVGLCRLNVPTGDPVATIDLSPGSLVATPDGGLFQIVRVELTHVLVDPPIPQLCLLCKKVEIPK
jgi:hypothetical protein